MRVIHYCDDHPTPTQGGRGEGCRHAKKKKKANMVCVLFTCDGESEPGEEKPELRGAICILD